MTQTVAVIDYGCGNLASVQKAILGLGCKPAIVRDPSTLHTFDRAILPGVGSFNSAMEEIRRLGFHDSILHFCGSGRPLLGICLGMQLLATSGQEGTPGHEAGQTSGLNLIPGEVVSLRSLGVKLPVPHVGWNSLSQLRPSDLFEGIQTEADVYFVHSFGFVPADTTDLLAYTEHGSRISAIVARENVTGCQFHPEKSSRVGSRLLSNWIQSC